MSSPDYKSMSNKELRDKLLEYGYDIPVSVNKDFLIKKLEAAIKAGPANKKAPIKNPPQSTSRKSVGGAAAASRKRPPPQPSGNITASTDEDEDPRQYFASTSTTNTASQARGRPSQTLTVSTNSNTNTSKGPDTTNSSSRRSTRGSIASPSVVARRVTPEPTVDRRSLANSLGSGKPPLKRPRPNDPEPEDLEELELEEEFTRVISRPRLSPSSTRIYMERFRTAEQSQDNEDNEALPPTNKFGLIVSGRMVQSEFIPNQEIDPKKFIIEIPKAENADYLAVFLNPCGEFPPGTAGQVYLGWPNSRKEVAWHLLGHISNIRPSAFFNITELKDEISSTEPHNVSFGSNSYRQRTSFGSNHVTAQVGISIEPLELVLSNISQKLQM